MSSDVAPEASARVEELQMYESHLWPAANLQLLAFKTRQCAARLHDRRGTTTIVKRSE